MDFRPNDTHERKLGFILAFGALLWTGTYNALAKGLTPFLSPISLLILSEALTAIFIILTFGLVPLVKKLMKMDGKSIRMAIIVGLLNSALCPLLWFTGLSQTSAINASMLSSADVLCVLILGSFLLQEKVSKMQAIGAGIVFIGVVVINVGNIDEGIGIHMGDLMVLSAALISGAGSVLFKKYLSHVMPELAIVIRNIAGIVAILIVTLFIQHSFVAEVQAFPVKKVILLVAFTFFSRYLNLTFYYEALDRLPATTISLIQIAAPLSGLVFAFLILGESIFPYQVLGGIFILFGLILEQVSEHSLRHLRFHSRLLSIFHLNTKSLSSQQTIQILPKSV